MKQPETFRDKLGTAMVGHTMAEITVVLIDALGAVLAESDPRDRDKIVEESCAEIARKATIVVGRLST